MTIMNRILIVKTILLVLSVGVLTTLTFRNSPTMAAAQTSFDQAAALAKLREAIKGKEKEPAETVFKNIQLLKGVPAGNLLRIMELGYGRSLGVDCTHCHTPDQWERGQGSEAGRSGYGGNGEQYQYWIAQEHQEPKEPEPDR